MTKASARTLLAVAFATMLTLIASVQAHADTRRIGLTSFDRLVVHGDMVVHVVNDRSTYAEVEGQRDALDALSLDVQDRVLTVTQTVLGRFGPRPMTAPPVVIRLHSPMLQQVVLRGTGQVDAGSLRGNDVRVELSGQGGVTARVTEARTLLLRANGAGVVTISGTAREVTAFTSGPGSIDAAALNAGSLTVRAIGSGASSFTSNGPVELTALGQAGVTVAGRPRCTVHNLGAGPVRCGDRTDRIAH